MGAHMCAWCNCDPCECKDGEGRNAKQYKSPMDDKKPGEPILGLPEVDKMLKGKGFVDPETVPSILDTPCGSCGKLKCDCVYKEEWFGHLQEGEYDKATVAAQMEDLGNPYRRMAKCVKMCDAAGIDLPKWCKEALLKWARTEVGNKERYLDSL